MIGYEEEGSRHVVEYDDGDVKKYVLSEKTFTPLKEDYTVRATGLAPLLVDVIPVGLTLLAIPGMHRVWLCSSLFPVSSFFNVLCMRVWVVPETGQ